MQKLFVGKPWNIIHAENNVLLLVLSFAAGESLGEKMTKWYVDPPQLVSSTSSSTPLLTEKAQLSSLPVITPAGLQQTMLAALGQSDPLIFTTSGVVDATYRPLPTSPEKKLSKAQPKGTIEYKVLFWEEIQFGG